MYGDRGLEHRGTLCAPQKISPRARHAIVVRTSALDATETHRNARYRSFESKRILQAGDAVPEPGCRSHCARTRQRAEFRRVAPGTRANGEQERAIATGSRSDESLGCES